MRKPLMIACAATSAAPSVARKPRPASVSASTCDRQRVTPCHLFALSPARANLIPVATGRRLCKRGAWPLARHVGLVMKCECIGGLCCGGHGIKPREVLRQDSDRHQRALVSAVITLFDLEPPGEAYHQPAKRRGGEEGVS